MWKDSFLLCACLTSMYLSSLQSFFELSNPVFQSISSVLLVKSTNRTHTANVTSSKSTHFPDIQRLCFHCSPGVYL